MSEFEFFDRPIELKPEETRLWFGETMIPFDLTDCNRLRINNDEIEFDCNRETHTISLEEEIFFVSSPYFDPIVDSLPKSYSTSIWQEHSIAKINPN